MATIVDCPNLTCRFTFPIGLDLDTTSFSGNGMNVAVECPRCGRRFDATGGGDGTFSTVGGRFRRVAKFISEADETTLSGLLQDLEDARRLRDVSRAKERLSEAGISVSGTKWHDSNFVLTLVTLLITVIGLVLQQRASGDAPTKAQIDKLISIEEQKTVGTADPPDPNTTSQEGGVPTARRNALCPCGSARKYKRCHGAHTSSPDHPDNSTP